MTRAELENTDWARGFKKDSPVSYKEGLRLAMSPKLRVEVNLAKENGDLKWIISAIDDRGDSGFWMDAKRTKADAVDLCRRMGWKISR